MSLTLIFWIVGLVVGVLMFLQAYAWNWKWWQCLLFAAAMTVVTVLVLGWCKSLVLKGVAKTGTVVGKVKALLG